MENDNVNKKIKELTDEQLKQVAGGAGSGRDCSYDIPACLKMDLLHCNCSECETGWELQWGELHAKGRTLPDKMICVRQ